MKRLSILLTLLLTIGSASAKKPPVIRVSLIPETQVIDATHLRRNAKDEIEVLVMHRGRHAALLTFHLNGQATAKVGYAECIRLYLAPGRYRFGVTPSHNFGRASFWEMNADVSRNTRQVYRIFQSAGFSSSGGNAVFEIARH